MLNVASIAAFQPLPTQATYSASKAFVLHFTQALAADLHGTGVTATALCPGPVKTEFVEVAGMEREASALPEFVWVPSPTSRRRACRDSRAASGLVIPGTLNKATAIGGHLTSAQPAARPRPAGLPHRRQLGAARQTGGA